MAIDTRRMAEYSYWLAVAGAVVGGLNLLLLLWQGIYTGQAAKAAKRSADHVLLTERAYVDMSPETRGSPIRANTPLDVGIKIKNNGRTPASVLNAALEARISESPLPDAFPAIAPKEPVSFWIQQGDAVHWWPDYKLTDSLAHDVVDRLNDPDSGLKCWIVGWVDYTDRFEKRIRHRFARRYHAQKFVLESKPGYNGDCDPDD
jgi:hypothetical protein